MRKRYYNYELEEWIIAKAEKGYREKILQTVNSNCNPVRGANESLVVKSISFSSSIGMGKWLPTCPRRN